MKTQYEYTHIIHYKYSDENKQRTYYYCNDSYSLSDSDIDIIKGELFIENNDEFVVDEYIGNDFNFDDYLSDPIICSLNAKCLRDNYVKPYCAYIQQIYCNSYGNVRIEYQRLIASSILKHIKAKDINKSFVTYVLDCVGLQLQEKGGVMAQLRLIANPPSDNTILKQLAMPSNITVLKHYLNRMDEIFSFKTEPSQLKIATVFYVFMERTELLRSEVVGKFDTVNRLLSDFYKIPKPTQRRGDVIAYLEKNYPPPKGCKKKSTLVFQENEHVKFWNSLK